MSNILFISPQFFNYHIVIKKELESLGYNVFWYSDRPSDNFISKCLIRLNKNFYKKKTKKYINKIIEETGVKNLKPVSNDILSLDVLTVDGHMKKGKYISSHLHLSVCYLLEADENEELILNEDETKGVMWIPINEVNKYSSEPYMVKLYEKLNEKIKTNSF